MTLVEPMMAFRIIPVLLIGIVCEIPVHAQRMPVRRVHLNPMAGRSADAGEKRLAWFDSYSGWAAFGKYVYSSDREHAWFQNLGGYLELFRNGASSNLVFLANAEIISNSANDIRFNPRAVFWEEGFLFTRAMGRSYAQIGYFHRCKHDLDNYTLGQERTLIYGSLQGNFLACFPHGRKNAAARLLFQNDIYTIRQDHRLPKSFESVKGHFRRLIGSARIQGDYHHKKPEHFFGYYAQTHAKLTLYGRRSGFVSRFEKISAAQIDYGFSAGALIGNHQTVRLGIFYERLSDTGIRVKPEKAGMIGIGLTAVHSKDVW